MRRLRWIEQQADDRQQVLDLRQVLGLEAAGAVRGPGGAVDLAVAEGDRQRDVVGEPLVAQLIKQGEGELDAVEIEPLTDRAGALEQHADRAVLKCRGLHDAVLGAKLLDLAMAAPPVQTGAEQLGVQRADVKRGPGQRQAEVKQPETQLLEKGPGIGQVSAVADQPVENRPRPARPGGRGRHGSRQARHVTRRCRPSPCPAPRPWRGPQSAPGSCDADARPARASLRSRSAGTG